MSANHGEVKTRKPIADMAKYLKDAIPANIPRTYPLKPVFKNISGEENVRSGVLAFREFLYRLWDRLIADGGLYDRPAKKEDAHVSLAVSYPFINNVRNVLFSIGCYGELTGNGDSLLLGDPQLLTNTIIPGGRQAAAKLSAPKIIEALKFLRDCGVCFDGIDLAKPDMAKAAPFTAAYPDDPAMLIGLKAMAAAQKEPGRKYNDEVFLRCDYGALKDGETDAASVFEEFIRPLPAKERDFALKLHRRCLDAGLTCKPNVSFLDVQFMYFYKNKEIWSFMKSFYAGYRILIKARNTQEYAGVIENFPLPLQEKIARGYGCEKKKFGEKCQKGCHGFSFPLDNSALALSREIETWIDAEFSCVRGK